MLHVVWLRIIIGRQCLGSTALILKSGPIRLVFSPTYNTTFFVPLLLLSLAVSTVHGQGFLRGVKDNAVRRALGIPGGECLPHEVYLKAKKFGTGPMWETVLATNELVGVVIEGDTQFSELSLQWIPSLDVILQPDPDTTVVDVLMGLADEMNLFCDPKDNEAFNLYLKTCETWTKQQKSQLALVEKFKEGADVVKNIPGETNSLRRYVIAEAVYHCERQKLFQEILPNVAAQAEVSFQNVRDADEGARQLSSQPKLPLTKTK